ncbi:MAG: acetate kinase [Candidatus Cloacimonadota bacterium]|nr:acetate kinase [Candidatus Cloacimonadota bacterium]
MNILVLNCGSSSIKFQLINSDMQELLAKGIVERIGEEISFFTFKSEKVKKQNIKISVENHTQGIKLISDNLMDSKYGVIQDKDDIDAIGHRLVHGGEEFSGSVKINEKVLDTMKECIKLAPLHNPHNIKGVEASQKIFPDIPQCGVFDTAFHQTMPKKAFLYALPLEYYTKHKIRRYGFHGTSHYYVAKEAARYVGKSLDELRTITCHLGNGASITAIDKGKSVDTSMGFTPLEGLVMGTRCGDLDPAIPLYMIETLGMNRQEVNDILNKKSGMLGLSEISNDMRVIEEEIEKKNQKASDALEIYVYRLKKYIGAYFTVMNGVDIIVFTGGIGENMPILREMVCTNLNSLGIIIDRKKNRITKDGILDFSGEDSKVKLLKIPTNEELMIAMETEAILKKSEILNPKS